MQTKLNKYEYRLYYSKSNEPAASFFRLLASLDPKGCSVISSN